MTLTFWSLYLPALAILLGLGLLAGIVEARVRSAFRRWRCQREMARMQRDLWKASARYLMPLAQMERRRSELDGLATARDKAERKIT